MRLLTIPLLFSLVYVHAQGNQAQYLNGKKYFAEGSYRDAMGSFQNLTDDREFGAYATFYYALSAYQQGLPKVALDTWKQAAIKFPTWDQAKEVDYWIAKVSIEQKKYLEGVRYMKRLPEDQANKLISSVLGKIDLPALKEAFSENDSNKDLALLYFKALSHQPFEQRDQTMILNLSSRFGFKVDNVVEDYSIVKKKHYAVALVLPFLFDSLQNPQSVIRNSIIYEMYQGMLLGRDSLESKGVSLRLFPYDTYKRKDKAQRLVSRGVLDKADVIIGPLYSGPNEVISAYSKRKEIPMINPLSANQDVISDNSYAYLFKPSYQTQGRMAGEYAKNKFQRNKKAIVLFETERDKLVAQAYHETIKDDFDIVLYDQLTQENALKMQLDFTEQYEHSLDSLTKSQIDSISDLPGRFIRSRVKRDEQTGSVIRNDKGEEVRSYYEMKFKIPKDTIGHIFAATSSNLLANNLISLTEVRGDSIGIIGYGNWLDFKIVSYGQLERLNVSMIHSTLFNENTYTLDEKVKNSYFTVPTKYHYLGFELIMQLGRLFDEHGKYFQRGLARGEHKKGILMPGLKYGVNRDNQIVPIITLEDLTLRVQNKSLYED